MVGKGDQTLVATAVVPVEAVAVDAGAQAFVEDALQVLGGVVLAGGAVEEARWRHLPGIAGDHHLHAASDGAHRVPGGDLRGFVEDHQVEQAAIRRQVLGDGQRTHQHAGRQPRQGVAHFQGQLAQRLVSALLLQFVLEHGEAAALARGVVLRWQAVAEQGADMAHGEGLQAIVQPAIGLDIALVLGRDEVAQQRLGI